MAEVKAPAEMGGEDMDSLYAEPEGDKTQKTEEDENQAETVMDKKILPPDTKPGDSCTFRVTEDFGKEFGLKYLSKTSGGEAEGGKTPAQADNEEIDAMDQGDGY